MVHVRVVAPPELADEAHRLLRDHSSSINVVRLAGAAERPSGDLILCDVASEDASVIIAELRELGLERDGSIALEPVSSLVSDAARRAEEVAVGSPADAVVWETVEFQTSEQAQLSASFLALMILATMIGALGILQDSQILIIGAMVVGPEFGPLAGVSVGLIQRRADLARRSLLALGVGFPTGMVAAFVLTLLLRATGSAPERLSAVSRPATFFISRPDEYTLLVALFAGAAGGLSLSTSKSGALVGVLISVTTIPAAANVGVATAFGAWHQVGGALEQLSLNLVCIVAALVSTLGLQRWFYRRRRRASRPRVAAGGG